MKWVSSTEHKRWTERKVYTDQKGEEILIGGQKGKPLYGFGVCFSELGLKAIAGLSEEQQKEIYDDLFGKDSMNFSFCRMPIGLLPMRGTGCCCAVLWMSMRRQWIKTAVL